MKLRKVFAGIAAAATMLGGLALGATTANAAETGSATITVNNAQTGHTYTAYKFATFSNPQTVGDVTSLDVATDDGWNTTLSSAVTSAGLTAGDEYADNYAAYLATLSAADLRKVADKLTVSGEGTATGSLEEDGTATISGLAEGWYIVKDTYTDSEGKSQTAPLAIVSSTLNTLLTGFTTSVALNTPDGQKDITAVGSFNSKSEDHKTPTPEKKVDGADSGNANIGDTKHNTISTVIPDVAAGYDPYTVTFVDQASKGLDIKTDTIQVFIDKNKNGSYNEDTDVLLTTTDYTVNTQGGSSEANGTTTTVTVADVSDYAGETLVLAYDAQVTKDAADTVTNTATVKDHNDVTSDGDKVTVYVGKFDFQKIGVGKDADGKSIGLDGAVFNVYKGSVAEANKLSFVKEADGKYYYDSAPAQGTKTTADLSTATVDAKGKLYVRGLADGTYVVKETTPASGYSKQFLAEFTVVIENGAVKSFTDNGKLGLVNGTAHTVLNVKSVTDLPLTGAAGTALFTLVGVLLAGAAVTVFAKSRSTKRALTA